MKTYEIKRIRAELVADICLRVEKILEDIKESNSSTIDVYSSSNEDYEKRWCDEAIVKNDCLSKIKITVDGIEL